MITKSGIRLLNEGIHQVQLPNGRIIELASREGADDFVDAVGTDIISTNLTATDDEEDDEDDEELATAYSMIRMAIDNASPEKIASGIPESELRNLMKHTRDTLDILCSDRNWIRSGALSICHELLLIVVAAFSKHIWFFKTFTSNEDMAAFAKFYASRKKNDTPNHNATHLIIMIVNNAVVYLLQEGLSHDKALGIVEKTGLLGQFIRCVPTHPEWSSQIVTSLQSCLQLVKKKLKSGTRTGDILDAVVAGEDGAIDEKTKASLARLQSLARLSNNNNDNRKSVKSCCRCEKMERQPDDALLKKCQRCKATYYCSKECQVADWKIHKRTCYEFSSGAVSRSEEKIADTTIGAVIELNFFHIAKEMYKKMQEYDVPKKELFLKIDFYGDAPALRNEVTVWLTSNALKGASALDVPDWFHTDAGRKDFAKYLRKQYDLVTSDHTLAVCRAANGVVNIRLVLFPVCDVFYKRLSDEAVESIGREDYGRMVACLGQTITNEFFEKRSGLV
jgi:hypothetical protein